MKPDRLILFDYSGTLSLQAVLFGQGDSLLSALEHSGLARLGITPTLFWEEIVNPTWEEGSTTQVGYRQVMVRRLLEGAAFQNPGAEPWNVPDLQRAVADFVNAYLASSCMEEAWRPLLRKLPGQRGLCAVIATDHYAEATPAIVNYLEKWDIPALPARRAFGIPQPPALIVANSADLGAHKTSPRFWQPLKAGLGLHELKGILLLDDFGYNEQAGDAYSERKRVEGRQEETTRLLREVFSVDPCIFPFFLERGKGGQGSEQLILQATLALNQFLAWTG